MLAGLFFFRDRTLIDLHLHLGSALVGLFAVLAGAMLLAPWACGESGAGGEGWLPGDSLSHRPKGPPVVSGDGRDSGAQVSRDGRDSGAQVSDDDPDSGAQVEADACASDSLNAGLLDLTAAWDDAHVRVSGTVVGGAGNTLNLGLSQADRFVYDEIFRGERFGSVVLESDRVDLTSVAYEPAPDEMAAFARTGARPGDRSRPFCLDLSLYESGSLDLLAIRHVRLSLP